MDLLFTRQPLWPLSYKGSVVHVFMYFYMGEEAIDLMKSESYA